MCQVLVLVWVIPWACDPPGICQHTLIPGEAPAPTSLPDCPDLPVTLWAQKDLTGAPGSLGNKGDPPNVLVSSRLPGVHSEPDWELQAEMEASGTSIPFPLVPGSNMPVSGG